jgi:hypothetical protein
LRRLATYLRLVADELVLATSKSLRPAITEVGYKNQISAHRRHRLIRRLQVIDAAGLWLDRQPMVT